MAPVVGSGAVTFARNAAKLQTILGEHQDSVTAQAWLRGTRIGGRRAFVAGELIAMEHIAAEDARKKWPKVWKALDRKSLRDWMPAHVTCRLSISYGTRRRAAESVGRATIASVL